MQYRAESFKQTEVGMQSGYTIHVRVIRAVGLVIAMAALFALVALDDHPALAVQSNQPVAMRQQGDHLPGALAEPTPEPSPVAPRVPALESPAVPAQCSGTDCTITSLAGWQQTPVTLRQGDQYSVTYVGGTWTVDKRNLPLVGPGGYSSEIDSGIGYPACKVDSRWPYAALLGKIDDGSVFLVDGGGTFTAERDGPLYLQINDATACQGDNEGSISVRITRSPCARLSVAPSYKEVSVGGTGTTEIRVADVSNLYGVQFHVSFDPNVLQVVDANPSTSGVQMGIGSLFSSKNHFVARNNVDNAAGVAEFVVTLVAPATPINGSGALAVITWQGRNGGQSPITLTLTGLAPASQPICHNIENGSIKVISSGPVISGRVLLQGAQDHSGTNVFLTEAPRSCTTKICVQELANVPLDVTDHEGRFEVSPDPGRSYPWLWAYRACYLTGAKQWPQGNVGTLTLPAGDLNEDNCVNIYDLAIMGQRYGGQGTCADFDQNGQVDIYDLVMVAGNFGMCGPRSNWR